MKLNDLDTIVCKITISDSQSFCKIDKVKTKIANYYFLPLAEKSQTVKNIARQYG